MLDGYPNTMGGLFGPYKEVKYYLLEFQQDFGPPSYQQAFDEASEIYRKRSEKYVKNMPSYPYEKQVQIVVATMILHN